MIVSGACMRAEEAVMKKFGYIERISKESMTNGIYLSKEEGKRRGHQDVKGRIA